MTDLAKKKQGNVIALSLPNKSTFGNDIEERVFEKLSVEDLKGDAVLVLLISDPKI